MFKITKNDREYTYKILPEQYVIEKAKIQIGKKIKEIEKIIKDSGVSVVIVSCVHDLENTCNTWVSAGGDVDKIADSYLPIVTALKEEIDSL